MYLTSQKEINKSRLFIVNERKFENIEIKNDVYINTSHPEVNFNAEEVNDYDINLSINDDYVSPDIFEYDEEGVMDVMREEGRADATLKDIRNIMTKLNKSADEAMDILDVPIKERETLKTQL